MTADDIKACASKIETDDLVSLIAHHVCHQSVMLFNELSSHDEEYEKALSNVAAITEDAQQLYLAAIRDQVEEAISEVAKQYVKK